MPSSSRPDKKLPPSSTRHQPKSRVGVFRGLSTRLRKLWSHEESPPQTDEAESHTDDKDSPPAYSAELEQTSTDIRTPPPPPPWSVLEESTDVSFYPGHRPGTDTSWSQMFVKVGPMDPLVVPRTILPFDATSFGTLVPIHPAISYHLAFYHLHWARRAIEKSNNLEWSVDLAACAGESGPTTTRGGGPSPNYTWSSELYWSLRLMQKQELSFRVDARSAATQATDTEITMCPHITVSLSRLRVDTKDDGGLKASAQVSYKPATHPRVDWASKRGNLAMIHRCTICFCDLEQSLEIRGHEVCVRFTVYRDLGDGIDRFDPKWRWLLTG
ncbi:hypothetical protein PG997_000053 [Apiospora hydei]|uniref:Uncharacterized protein n=1 Tax=Apiospora hydei TaxID=1337664 RepID=A0ABR1X9N4_9PEZI